MSESELKAWAEAHAPAGSEVAKAVLALFGKMDAKNGTVLDRAPVIGRPLTESEKEIVLEAGASYHNAIMEKLRPKKFMDVSKPFDGSTGTPEHGRAGFQNPPPPGAGQ